MLQDAQTRAWQTEDLTKSFGWTGAQYAEQQDVSELNRVLFDAVEKSLEGTIYDSMVQELFFGRQEHVITCLKCNTPRSRPE